MNALLRGMGAACLGLIVVVVLLGNELALILAGGLGIAGVVFYALVAILERLERIDTRLAAGTQRIATNLGDFEKLGNDVKGEATCIGCKRTVPKAGLYYHKGLDVYYHPECLTRDRSL